MKLCVSRFVNVLLIGLSCSQLSIAQQTNDIGPGSYEYKVMLDNEKFISLAEGIQGFKNVIPDTIAVFKGKKSKKPKYKKRIVMYLDTKQCHLKNNDFILRKRFTLKDGIPDSLKVTLKFRGVDVNAVEKKMFLAHPSLSLTKSKFEADIVNSPSSSATVKKYSRSASIALGKFKTLSDLMLVYPVLGQLGSSDFLVDPDEKLKRVRAFVAFETVVDVGSIKFPEGSCDASFSFWYKTQENSLPFVSEFSYVCEKDTNQANLLFQSILNFDEWRSSNPTTKTSIAYGKFCTEK